MKRQRIVTQTKRSGNNLWKNCAGFLKRPKRIRSRDLNVFNSYSNLKSEMPFDLKSVATRVDWTALAVAKDAEALESTKVQYKPRENREDITSKQVMSLIDRLDKRVKRARAVYEVLCEFAHPNVGLLHSLTRSAKPVLDAQGIGWIRKELSLDPPV